MAKCQVGQYTRRTVVRRELARTRANSSELARTPHEFAIGSPTPTLRRTPANVRRSTPNVRRSSPGFARVRPQSAANWRTVRQKIRSREEITSTSDERSPRTSPPRTGFAANVKFGEQVRQKFLGNGHNSSLPRTSSLLANHSSPRTGSCTERTRNYDLRNSVRS